MTIATNDIEIVIPATILSGNPVSFLVTLDPR